MELLVKLQILYIKVMLHAKKLCIKITIQKIRGVRNLLHVYTRPDCTEFLIKDHEKLYHEKRTTKREFKLNSNSNETNFIVLNKVQILANTLKTYFSQSTRSCRQHEAMSTKFLVFCKNFNITTKRISNHT